MTNSLDENNFIKKSINGSVLNNKLIGYVREYKMNYNRINYKSI